MHKTATLVAGVLAMVCVSMLGATEPPLPTAGDLLAQISEIGLDLHLRLMDHAGRSGEGNVDPREVDAIEQRLDELEQSIAHLPDDFERARLEEKTSQLQCLLYNLNLVSFNPAVARELPSQTAIMNEIPRLQVTSVGGSPINDGCANATPTGLEQWIGETSNASNDGQASCGASLYSPDVWFLFTAPEDGIYYATTIGSEFDTVLSAHTACPGTPENELLCNDDSYGLWSSIPIDADVGDQFFIRVAGSNGVTGEFHLTIERDAWISGRVHDSANDEPVDTWIYVYGPNGVFRGSGRTDGSGDYTKTGLDGSDYFVKTNNIDGYHIDEIYDDIPCPTGGPPEDCDATSGNSVPTSLGTTTTGIDFALQAKGSISGAIIDAITGLAISSSEIVAVNENGISRTARSLADGTYFVQGLDSGDHVLLVRDHRYQDELFDGIPCQGDDCDLNAATPINVTSGQTTEGIDVDLVPLGSISGQIVDAGTGDPIAFVRMHVHTEDDLNHKVSGADELGQYTVSYLAPNTYFVTAESWDYADALYNGLDCSHECDPTTGTPVLVEFALDTPGIDFELVPVGQISGTVREMASGLPMNNVKIELWNTEVWNSDSGSVDGERTEADGTFLFGYVPPGDYFLSTSRKAPYLDELYSGIPCLNSPPRGCNPTKGTPVVVTPGNMTSGVDFFLMNLADIILIDSFESGSTNGWSATDPSD